jgi:Flp pilus assembly pilin Flp
MPFDRFPIWRSRLRRLPAALRSEAGVASTEYGVLLALVAIGIVVAATTLGLAIAGMFDHATPAVSGV